MRTVDNPDDPALEPFRDIRERDLVRSGGFIAEGTVVARGLISSPFFRPTALLTLRSRLSGIADIVERMPSDAPVLVTDNAVLDRIAGFAVHRGVLAHGVAREATEPLSLTDRLAGIAAKGGTVVVAVGIANHDNIGAIFRNAAAFGADLVLLDAQCCDPLYRKALRVSVGAVLQVPFVRLAPAQALDALRAAGFRTFALSPQGDPDLSRLERLGPAALFLGTEGEGLPSDLMACMEGVRIDMVPGFDSLNVATSAAIALQRIYSARRGASPA